MNLDWPTRLWNKAPATYFVRLHQDGGSWGSSISATNQASIDLFGDTAEEEAEFPLVGHAEMAAAIIKRHMIHRSGRSSGLDLTMTSIEDGITISAGQKIDVTARNMIGDWIKQQTIVQEINDGLSSASPSLRSLMVGAYVGPIQVTSEQTARVRRHTRYLHRCHPDMVSNYIRGRERHFRLRNKHLPTTWTPLHP